MIKNDRQLAVAEEVLIEFRKVIRRVKTAGGDAATIREMREQASLLRQKITKYKEGIR